MRQQQVDLRSLPETTVSTSPKPDPFKVSSFLDSLVKVREFDPCLALPFDQTITLFTHRDLPLHILTKDPLRAEFGGKARGILNLMQNGIPAGPALFVASDVFADLITAEVHGEKGHVPAPLSFLGTSQLLQAATMQAGFQPLAYLRSSSPYEDSARHTSAGLFKSRAVATGGPDDAFETALQEVLESAFSARALAFSHKYALPPQPLPLVVQPVHFDAERAQESQEYAPALSGVVDTAHPSFIRVSLARGLGTAIVDGHFCYKVLISREGLKPFEAIGHQRSEFVLQHGSAEAPLLDERYFGDGRALQIEDPQLVAEKVVRILAERDGSVLRNAEEFEFCLPAAASNALFLQRRSVRALEANFELSAPALDMEYVSARQFCGQGITTRLPVFVYRVRSSPEEIASEAARLQRFNAQHTNGFVVLALFEAEIGYQRLSTAARSISYESFYNARGVAFAGPQSDAYRFELSEFSHFSQFFRSEGTPVIGIFREELARSVQGRQLIHGASEGKVMAVVAVDEVSNRGYLAFSS